jgi:type IV secretion system protein VirB10
MAVREMGDPRLQAMFAGPVTEAPGIRPVVRLPSKGLPPAAIAIVAFVAAVILFLILNGRRTAQPEPAVIARAGDAADIGWAAPPPLYIPPVSDPVTVVTPGVKTPMQVQSPMSVGALPEARSVAAPMFYQPAPAPAMSVPVPPPALPRIAGGPALVIDTGQADSPQAVAPGPQTSAGASSGPLRMRASVLANRAMTVPQGHVISAVLETGFDSTRPGFARAIVSRDVRGFDGKNVLIPRGSRLVGEYRADVAQGQKRAIITWTRLIRPDGMTIVLNSPAVDTLGRGGVPASVNSHFFQRFGDALLQSTVGVGQALANRTVAGPVVVVPGGGGGAAAPAPTSGDYTPTLSVRPGTSISVFVAHDLDFSAQAGR